jgi:hypothetical protein
MYSREFQADQEINTIGKPFREIFFITHGKVNLVTKQGITFMQLPECSILGDY